MNNKNISKTRCVYKISIQVMVEHFSSLRNLYFIELSTTKKLKPLFMISYHFFLLLFKT